MCYVERLPRRTPDRADRFARPRDSRFTARFGRSPPGLRRPGSLGLHLRVIEVQFLFGDLLALRFLVMICANNGF